LVTGVTLLVAGYGVLGLIYGVVITRTLTTGIALALLRLRLGPVDLLKAVGPTVTMLKAGVPFLMIVLFSAGFWVLNTLFLSVLRPVADVGLYNAAFRVPDLLRTIFYSYMIAVLPVMAESFATSIDALKQHCDTSVKYMALVTIPASTGLALLAPRILGLMYGHEFDAAVPVLQVLAWTVAISSIGLVFGRVLAASGRERLDLSCLVAALVINAALGWVLVPRYGATGASIALAISLVAFGVFELIVVSRCLFRPDVLKPLLRASGASLVMALILRLLEPLPLALVPVMGAAVYAAALVSLGTFSRAELSRAWQCAATFGTSLRLMAPTAASGAAFESPSHAVSGVTTPIEGSRPLSVGLEERGMS
jgi:O-antigen/teichoic acid export membrane protein